MRISCFSKVSQSLALTDLLPCCSTIRIPFDFRDGSGGIPKLFVVVGHHNNCVVVFKTTSKLDRFGSNPDSYTGTVFISATGVEPFISPTMVDPSNAFAIPYSTINYEKNRDRLRVWPSIENLQSRLCAAIDQNITLTKSRKASLKACLGCLV